MKKSILRFMMMALMGCVCTTFTACGGDDDDNVPGQDVSGTMKYFEPCFDWGANAGHVKAYMSGWELVEGSNDYALLYTNNKNTVTVEYGFFGGNKGLSMVVVDYITVNANYIKSEIERRYNMTLAKDGEESQNGETTYYGYGVIGDRTIAVLVHSTSDTVRVIYGIPD